MKKTMAAIALFFLCGCGGSYINSGGAVSLTELSDNWKTDQPLDSKPAAAFPARLAVARVQDKNRRTYLEPGVNVGRYTLITSRNPERDEHMQKITGWPQVAGVAPLNGMVMPESATDGDLALRRAAASLHADMLVVYTFDTSTQIKDHELGPLNTIFLGFLPNQEAIINTTASAMIVDVRTGYIYGLSEFTARESRGATVWSKDDAADACRIKAEAKAFDGLVTQMTQTWAGIVATHASTP